MNSVTHTVILDKIFLPRVSWLSFFLSFIKKKNRLQDFS